MEGGKEWIEEQSWFLAMQVLEIPTVDRAHCELIQAAAFLQY